MDCVRDWWNGDDAKPIEFATVGWEGTNAAPRERNATIRLYVTAWENPFPGKKVQTVDYITNNTLAAPFCVAMTLD